MKHFPEPRYDTNYFDSNQIVNFVLSLQILVDRLEIYQEYTSIPKKPNMVHFPPEPEPIPCKPLFFDVASNHIDLPDIEHRLEKKKEAGGISGMVKGWFWGSN